MYTNNSQGTQPAVWAPLDLKAHRDWVRILSLLVETSSVVAVAGDSHPGEARAVSRVKKELCGQEDETQLWRDAVFTFLTLDRFDVELMLTLLEAALDSEFRGQPA